MPNFDFLQRDPDIHPSAFVAPRAELVGDVTVAEEASIWYGCVLRGDINRIVIGARSNVQDGTVVHLSDDYGAIVGEDVTIGHRALVHACEIGDGALIGMGAIIMDGAEVGAGSIVAAGAVVTAGTIIPPGTLALGTPTKVVRELDETERLEGRRLAQKYVEVAKRFREKLSTTN